MRQMYQSLACLLHEHVQDGYLMVCPLPLFKQLSYRVDFLSCLNE